MESFQSLLSASTSTIPGQCITTGILNSSGDLIAQFVIERKSFSKYDGYRTVRMGVWGMFIFSPIIAIWLTVVLERIPLEGLVGSLVKVALDQVLVGPTMLALFLTTTTLMAGKTLAEAKAKLKEHWWKTLVKQWMVWIPVMFLNIQFFKPEMRLLVANLVGLAWNTFMSLVAGRPSPTHEFQQLPISSEEAEQFELDGIMVERKIH